MYKKLSITLVPKNGEFLGKKIKKRKEGWLRIYPA